MCIGLNPLHPTAHAHSVFSWYEKFCEKMATLYKREESFDIFESNELPVLQVLFILKKDGWVSL